MSKHTPGPWQIVRNRDGSLNVVGAEDAEHESCKVALVNNRNEANARLIAAAPDLLQTLRDAAGEFHDIAHSSGDPSDPANMETPAVMYRVCMEAIARAEGTP